MEDEILRDKNGRILEAGEFFWYSAENTVIPAGPYRYDGFRSGSHRFSVGGASFLTGINPSAIEAIPWKRWRASGVHLKRFVDYVERHAAQKRAEKPH